MLRTCSSESVTPQRELVEDGLPAARVDRSGGREDAIEIDEDGLEVVVARCHAARLPLLAHPDIGA
jgi:hypothetical protein